MKKDQLEKFPLGKIMRGSKKIENLSQKKVKMLSKEMKKYLKKMQMMN